MSHHHAHCQVRYATPNDLPGARALMLDTFHQDFGYGFVPHWHADVVDLQGSYLDHPRHTLIVAVHGDEVIGTTAVNSSGPAHPPHPRHMAERFPCDSTAQLLRVYVRAAHRRLGLARRMVDLACAFATEEGGYNRIYLHTNTDIPGAEPFWRKTAEEVFDARPTGEHGPGVSTVHFEIPMPARADAAGPTA
ncbi:GNAT family N-acetyltransferase [Kitasatospora indigofera]|uniref:GNAT family N-acetyltransferase n=2 Tax=Kitasatospora indigofera TaxID=67307 RepID=UPI0036AD2A55